MEWLYPTRFTDKWGTETTAIRNDGTNLSVTLRGVQFSGPDFDMLEPAPHTPTVSLAKFAVSSFDCLCACVFDIEIETPVLLAGEEQKGLLTAHLELGGPIATGGLDRESLRLSLRVDSDEYSSDGTTGFFELELLSLLQKTSPNIRLKMCFTCAYSDYSPVGHGLFGGMACFRHSKPEYSRVQGKAEIMALWNKAERVQETFLCPEFKIRKPNTGFRG